jgi:pimeloyl-ACP methyl ester carboxylesterase
MTQLFRHRGRAVATIAAAALATATFAATTTASAAPTTASTSATAAASAFRSPGALTGLTTRATAAGGWSVSGPLGDGSQMLLEVPGNWNGTLLLFSHGYRSPIDGSRAAQDAPTPDTGQALLTQGYALIGSSYPGNGWAVYRGTHSDELLIAFAQELKNLRRIYAWGDSLGGLITQTLAERHPDEIAAAAPMCGVLAGANMNLDEALDVGAMLRALLVPGLKLRGYHSYADAQANNDKALATIESDLASTDQATASRAAAAVLAIAALADAPHKTQHFDGNGLQSAVGAAVEAIGNALFFGTVGRYDIEQRMGGDPSTNVGVDYRKRISAADVAWYESFGFAGSLLNSFAQQVQTFAPRVAAIPAARIRFARTGGNPTGRLGVPTVTMHTEDDPLVIVQNERVFETRVATQGQSGRLLQLYVKPPASYPTNPGAAFGAGHCVFTTGDRVALVKTIDTWLAQRSKPTAAQVAALFPSGEGLDLGYRPFFWPVR